MAIIGFIAAIFIGISLGLIGGGGSILTVPVLFYLFELDMVTSTAYSLFIVGITSLIGSFQYYRRGLVNLKTAVVFGIPSIVAVYITRAFILPAIPEQLGRIGDFEMSKDLFLMLLFSLLMIAASFSMIRKSVNKKSETGAQKFNYPLIFIEGSVVGILTGLVGAGGGFLIIPALVMLSKLPMKEAVGTSLVIIATKSLIGFQGDLWRLAKEDIQVDWNILLVVSSFAIAGIFLGNYLSSKVNGDKLKPAFGWFVLLMGSYIIVKELFLS
jgi:uncharacterized membrane protein YfcA